MMTFRGIDEDEAEKAVDRLLAAVTDDYLTEPEQPSVRRVIVRSGGRIRAIKVTGNIIWFPISARRKAK